MEEKHQLLLKGHRSDLTTLSDVENLTASVKYANFLSVKHCILYIAIFSSTNIPQ